MLNKKELRCKCYNEVLNHGVSLLNSIKYDTENKVKSFDVVALSRMARILSDNYLFCYSSYSESKALEIINTSINVI